MLIEGLRAVVINGGVRSLLGGLSFYFGRGAVGAGSVEDGAGGDFGDRRIIAGGCTAGGYYGRIFPLKVKASSLLYVLRLESCVKFSESSIVGFRRA